MLRANPWNRSVSPGELHEHAREGCLRLERLERLLLSRIAVPESWLRRVVCLFSVRACSEGRRGYRTRQPRGYRTREPLSNRHPDRMPEIHLDRNLRKVFSRNIRFTSIVVGT
jgi:hypothetical protein